jgi:hypothetical protein
MQKLHLFEIITLANLHLFEIIAKFPGKNLASIG